MSTSTEKTLNILEISASGRSAASVSRQLTRDLINAIEAHASDVSIQRRDLANTIDAIDEDWINANFTPVEDRNDEQKARLAPSDQLVDELKAADVVVMGAPIYNFGVPAALKAWVDMIARARLTFRYTENGPEGLLKGKRAYIVVTSGGVPVDSPVDFATPYLRQALRFVGIEDITVIAADQLNANSDESINQARAEIARVVYTEDRGPIAA